MATKFCNLPLLGKRVAQISLAIGVIAYLLKRQFQYLIRSRYGSICLPAIDDYIHEDEKNLMVRIFGGGALEPYLVIRIWERMGRPEVFKARLLFHALIHSTVKDDYDLAVKGTKTFLHHLASRFVGPQSIVFHEGHRHKRERAILSRGFTQQSYRIALPMMIKAAQRLRNRLQLACNNESKAVVEFEPFIAKYTLEVVAESAFSYDLSQDEQGIAAAVRRLLKLTAHPLCSLPLIGPALVEWLEWDTVGKVFRVLDDAIDRRAKAPHLSEEQLKKRGDVLDLILASSREAKDEYAALRGPKWVRDQVQVLFIAGTDTTGSTLHWAVALLAQHSDIQQRVKAEIKDSLERKDQFESEFDRIQSLTYTEAFIKEVLRFYPPAGVLRTLPDGQTAFHGVDISGDPNAVVLLNQYLVQRREEYFPDPLRFSPERWLTPGLADNEAFGSFSYGSRICLGKNFSLLELKAGLAVLLEEHCFQPLIPDQPLPRYELVGDLYGPVGDYPLIYQKDA